jgi:predicted PurR-regulated permease PerM
MTLTDKPITFDSFIRGVLTCLVAAGVLYLLNILSGVLTPFFVAWLLAYLLFPLVKFFQYKCRLRYRILAILCAFTTVGLIIWAAFWLIVPPMVSEALKAKDLLVDYINNDATISSIPAVVQEYMKEYLSEHEVGTIITYDNIIEGVKATLPQVWKVIDSSLSVVSGLLSVTMIVLYTIFILLEYEQFSTGWVDLLPKKMRRFATQLVDDVTTGMNKYFRGQALVASCVGILFCIGFLIIDFPMAIALGVFIGMLNMVPYMQLIGFIPTILLAIVKSADTGQNFWVIFLSALVVFAVVQVIQDTLLTPKIMGKVTGLNAAIILLSLSIWGSLLGVLGMIIALPMTTLLLNYYQKYIIKSHQEAPQKAGIMGESEKSSK